MLGAGDFLSRIKAKRRIIIESAALAGMLGPVLFVTILLGLTALQYDFMMRIGWRPLADPAGAWPSGLALGSYSRLQDVNFVVSGSLLTLLALGLHLGVGDGRSSALGPALLFLAGTAMALMGFEPEPIPRTGPRSLHGLIHHGAFVLFVFAFLTAHFSLWRRFRTDPHWWGYARYTLTIGMLAVLLLLLSSAAYYLFVVMVLAWIEVSAIRLWRSS